MLAVSSAKFRAIIVLLSIILCTPLHAQTITVNPNTLDEPLRQQLVNEYAFFVNGPLTQGLTLTLKEKLFNLGPLSRSLLALITLRMNAEGLLDLDEAIVQTLPDMLEDNPFNVAITSRHILTETAGFAVPSTISSSSPIRRYTTQVRTAAQMAHADDVGWALLMLFLEAKGGTSFEELASTYLLDPTGIKTGISLPRDASPLTAIKNISGSGQLIAEIVRLMIRNRDKNGARFLPSNIYEQLVSHHNWRMHPIGPRRTLGGVMHALNKRTYISPPDLPHSKGGPSFLAFPDQGIAFINLKSVNSAYLEAVSTVADNLFLQAKPDFRLNEAKNLRDAQDRFSGAYVRSDAPSAWLNDRLTVIKSNTLQLEETDAGTLTIQTEGSGLTSYRKIAPFYYKSPSDKELLLSPFRQGGYLVLDGVLYRYVGILGNKTFVLDAFPLVILILLSSIVYIRSKTSLRWRKMAQFSSIGTVMVLTGLAGDYYFWPNAVFHWDMPWLVNLWRTILNIGLALVLSQPLFALAFTKKNEMPEGAAIFIAPFHLALLSIASIALFLIMVAWGIAGEFSAY